MSPYIWMAIAIIAVAFIIGLFSKKMGKKRQHLRELNQEILDKEAKLGYLAQAIDRTQAEIQENERTIVENRFTIDSLANRKKELNNDIATQVENIEKLKTSYQTTEEEFRKKYMAERKEWLDERQTEYVTMQEEFVEQFREENSKKMAAAQELTEKLSELQSKTTAAVEVAKRHAEEENFTEFHSLQIDNSARNDIREIEEVLYKVSQEAGEAIAKVIWKVYYEKPYTDLCGRVIGSGRHTGIYRITNSNTQMCYIGQAVDIADRWRQHIKRALGAEPRTQNKLYPAMYKEGIENFTFEVIEECDQTKLNEREDYWQDFYKAKEYGYSIK